MTKKLSRSSYIRAVDGARIFDLQGDYVTRLAKRGDVRGEKKGRVWYVEVASLEEYFLRQVYERAKRNMQLSKVRVSERKTGVVRKESSNEIGISARTIHSALLKALSRGPVRSVTERAVISTRVHSAPLYAVTPALDFLHKVGALVVASVATFIFASGVLATFREGQIGKMATNETSGVVHQNTAALRNALHCLSFSNNCINDSFLDKYTRSGFAEIRVESVDLGGDLSEIH